MSRAPATAKLNLALVVGRPRSNGLHEVATVLQRIDLADRIQVEAAEGLRVQGFAGDTLVRSALEQLAAAAGREPRWRARIWKHVPVAAGLGGGSSDAATALRLANEALPEPLDAKRLHELAAALGADRRPRDLAALPSNDLAPSPHADRMRELGAFRADVSGAGPVVYGLFLHRAQAVAAERVLRRLGRTWVTVPTWYG